VSLVFLVARRRDYPREPRVGIREIVSRFFWRF
jgi:hypothetical protein